MDISHLIPYLGIIAICSVFLALVILPIVLLKKKSVSENLKRIFKDAFYIAVFSGILGSMLWGLGMVFRENVTTFIGGALIVGSIDALVFLSIEIHKASEANAKQMES